MFNRANKATALLVAAAAVISLVPATGVNAADYKRIESKDGTVYNAVAYKNGSFVIDGNVKDEDTDAVYFLNEGKYTELEDVDTGSDFDGTYGEKYLSVDGGDYYVDLTNGKVTDDDVKEDQIDEVATTLRKKIRNNADDRFSDHDSLKESSLKEMAGNKFGETWYETTYTAEEITNGTTTGAALNVYTDAKGNYIDADYNLGKIKVKVSNGETTSSSVTIENTDDKYDSLDKKDLSAKVSNATVIGQDSNNIYRIATITVNAGTNTVTEINGKDVSVDANTFQSEDANKTVSFKVIQKISKAQASGDIDGAKYAKTVTNYVIADEDAKAETLLANAKYSIVGGKVVAHTFASDEVKAQTIEFKTSRGFNYIETKEADEEEAVAVDVDADGNLWRLDSGFVYKFDNKDDWNKVYKVDGSMDKMSVYNKDNMVIWNEEDEVYSVIGAKDGSDETEKPEVTTGWVKNSDGTWTFVKEDGTKAIGWLNNNGTWYFLDAAGIMQTGWINDNGTWYYTNASGAMMTGWQNVNGTWYFMQGSGAMKTGWINDNGTWYYTNASGAMQTGWLNDNGTWYFLDGSGKMLSNTTVNGYVLGANGAWIR
ncbi:N-acetylmuramoyl-L-alanine amidase family protein [Clostridium botulinum]|uniref:N-acetylmuramoyl-L-alanine amidase family protein n=1 Tax=Clostridium botulinum TaxID=1491 RepID=UPI0013F0D94D|nr:N-acetylmuramoyl-L-alanine amidase family protein [Clostridium botulinum]MCS6111267.1 N-acetylmuramoyl-L-alanine amidase family protein [Clostridium botulinum]NFE10856.1 N-acetylmuramoyl-L-alanine amidase family protein [Clostridium botulinum]NFL41532.1 N-acetylmuramoyl-L-alanine amidase family protein [Clostridium botulinum]NFN23232.1 N-acetylmuramoyl-L-alanine amidase family protein [Clostridium botulinum]NFN41022.1 N-acetylmuramoyl-L-alanine amidase family protein [Clostridium botulinum]